MIRILINHPAVEISFVHSKSNAGKFLYAVHEDLVGETDRKFDAEWHSEVDVVFLCVGHGEAKKFLDEHMGALGRVRIIDLSQDYRLNIAPFIYGLPELNRESIPAARYIANPGCFATAIQLGLLPLAKAGLLGDVYTTGITGSTGAGQSLSPTSHFSWRANNVQAYKTLTHQHLKEVGQSLQQLQASFGAAAGPRDEAAPGVAGGASWHTRWGCPGSRGRRSDPLRSLERGFYQGYFCQLPNCVL